MNTNLEKNKTYHITTFGCQMNVSDSERIATIAENLGYTQSTTIDNADLIIINSCAIRQKAEDRVIGMGKKIQNFKSQNSNLVTVLTGCMAKRAPRGLSEDNAEIKIDKYDKNLKRVMPWLDHILDIQDMHKLGSYLGMNIKIEAKEYLSVIPKSTQSFFQYIPISTGCNKFCTFCIVPFSRGRELYRPFDEILHEINHSIQNGAKEITLLGQNVNSWRGYKDNEGNYNNRFIESSDPHRLLKKDFPKDMIDFADLLDEIGSLVDQYTLSTGNKVWIKFTSSHPYDIDDKLINVIKNHKSIAKQLHFALQSGSNSVLKRMNRHYSIEEFIIKYNMIREQIPEVGISTDIIVGFCGETEQEFQDTVKIMKDLKFDQAFISEYSTRKGTVAERVYKDNVPNEVKSYRKEFLNQIVSNGNKIRNDNLLNKNIDILIYKKGKFGWVGRSESNKDIILKDQSLNTSIKLGEFLKTSIVHAENWSLEGKLFI